MTEIPTIMAYSEALFAEREGLASAMTDGSPKWPPKFRLTAESAAGLYLRARFPTADRGDQLSLAEIIKVAWREGYDAAKRGDQDQ